MSKQSESKWSENKEVDDATFLDELSDPDLKIILLGDSAAGKSKLIERFLMDEYNPRQLSTYALTLYRKEMKLSESNQETTVI
eukprot:gene15763-21344_t